MKRLLGCVLVAVLVVQCSGCRRSNSDSQESSPSRGARTPPAGESRPQEAQTYVGLRRSSYGLRARSADHEWWATRAKQFAANFPNARPLIIQIVSTYRFADGSTEFEFARPDGLTAETPNISFRQGELDHEAALRTYAEHAVKAIIQIEPGNADVGRCLEIAREQFGRHDCVIGYGVDLEWHFYRETPGKRGRPVTDAEAQRWMETVASFKSGNVLFLKHWDPRHMPPTYRHERLWFLSDSQNFAGRDEMMADFRRWAKAFENCAVGYQFGYPKDRPWWSKLDCPPGDIAQTIRESIPNARCLFWVDFTADRVTFRSFQGPKPPPAELPELPPPPTLPPDLH